MADSLDDLWPDPDRRNAALERLALLVHGGERVHNERRQRPRQGAHDLLSPIEVRCLLVLSHGVGLRGAAELLGVGLETVKTHTKHARWKLRAKNTTHAVAIAIRQGIID